MFNSYVKIQEGDNVQLPPHSEKILRPKQKGLAQTPKTNDIYIYMAVCQNLVPLVNIKIAGNSMFIPLKMVCIGIDP